MHLSFNLKKIYFIQKNLFLLLASGVGAPCVMVEIHLTDWPHSAVWNPIDRIPNCMLYETDWTDLAAVCQPN